jgi:pyruvate dehydrogenase E1 component alpha subunit
MAMHLSSEDYLSTIYRGIHDMVAKGVPLKALWAELAGKETGTCKGKGGPMHITHPESGCMVTTGIVGSSIPIGTGLALAAKMRGETRVAVACFGDGATNIGQFHEGLNLASVWKLPVIFLCQNNQYAEHTTYAKGTSAARVVDRAVAYGMPGIHVDGNDPLAMYQAFAEAVARARAGEGPTLIEAMTFRFNGHTMGDDSHYIPKEEMAQAKANDPYVKYRSKLITEGLASATELDQIDAGIKQEIDEAVEFAMNSNLTDLSELKRDVYAHDVA